MSIGLKLTGVDSQETIKQKGQGHAITSGEGST